MLYRLLFLIAASISVGFALLALLDLSNRQSPFGSLAIALVSIALAIPLLRLGRQSGLQRTRQGRFERLLSGAGISPAEAEARAHALLKECLTTDEYRQLERKGYLDVPSPNNERRIYRIPMYDRIEVHEDGRLVAELCVVVTDHVPLADEILIKKMFIENDEAYFLEVANRFPV